jgi:hypothetical protein
MYVSWIILSRGVKEDSDKLFVEYIPKPGYAE